MALARDTAGVDTTARALWSQVHPVFMTPPLAASLFGAILAGTVDPLTAAVHVVAMFAAVYTAHVKDGYVDFHVRGEDDDHPLTERGCRIALGLSTAVFALCCVVLGLLVEPVAVVLVVPTWLIAYHHAPQLDMNPVTATTGYPWVLPYPCSGVLRASRDDWGRSARFRRRLPHAPLRDQGDRRHAGLRVRSLDRETDRRGRRRPRPCVQRRLRTDDCRTTGRGRFRHRSSLPLTSLLAVLAFVAVAGVARRADPELATMLLIRGSYVFLAVLVAAVRFDPLGRLV